MTNPGDKSSGSATSSDEQSQATDSSAAESSEWSLQVQMAFDPADTNSLVVTIITAVADAEGTTAVENLDPPLQDVVDVDAVSKSFARHEATDTGQALSVEFPYREHRIVVRADAWVQVYSKIDE